MLGSEYIMGFLKGKAIDRIYTFPGGTLAPLFDASKKRGVEILCACHEQGAGYAALAVARLTNTPQVVMVTSGPGVTNVMTVVADAYFDSTPLIVFTGQVGTGDLTSDRNVRQRGFQQVDTISLMASICKQVYLPMSPDELPQVLADAFLTATNGRPGPVVIDIPMDVQRSTIHKNEIISEQAKTDVKNKIDNSSISEAVALIRKAKQPVILAGQGVLISRAEEELRQLAYLIGAPVVTSLLGIGSVPTGNEASLGFIGHTGNQCAGLAVHESDLLIVAGARLDVRQTGTVVHDFLPNGKMIRIDVDENELAFPRLSSEVNICADAKRAIKQILKDLKNGDLPDSKAWQEKINAYKQKHGLRYNTIEEGLKPQAIIETLSHLTQGKNAIVVTGVGSHQQWAARHFDFDFPRRILLTSGGHGAMGYDLPSAIGAQIARPKDMVLCIVGDGSLQINIQELQTAINYKLPIKIIVLDNKRLAMVSQFQLLNWGDDPTTGNKKNPNFASVAEAYRLKSVTITNNSEMEKKILTALNHKGPALIHCRVDNREDIIPILLADQPIDKMWKNE